MKTTETRVKGTAPKGEITREHMLKRMGIKDEDFRDYLKKHASFVKSLNASQRKFHHQNTPKKKVADVAKSLGPEVTTEHIKKLFKEAPPVRGLMGVSCCGVKSPPPHP
jgi:hypothetical protein